MGDSARSILRSMACSVITSCDGVVLNVPPPKPWSSKPLRAHTHKRTKHATTSDWTSRAQPRTRRASLHVGAEDVARTHDVHILVTVCWHKGRLRVQRRRRGLRHWRAVCSAVQQLVLRRAHVAGGLCRVHGLVTPRRR
jgi:hypothetical protein